MYVTWVCGQSSTLDIKQQLNPTKYFRVLFYIVFLGIKIKTTSYKLLEVEDRVVSVKMNRAAICGVDVLHSMPISSFSSRSASHPSYIHIRLSLSFATTVKVVLGPAALLLFGLVIL